jgi:hypothetical protein
MEISTADGWAQIRVYHDSCFDGVCLRRGKIRPFGNNGAHTCSVRSYLITDLDRELLTLGRAFAIKFDCDYRGGNLNWFFAAEAMIQLGILPDYVAYLARVAVDGEVAVRLAVPLPSAQLLAMYPSVVFVAERVEDSRPDRIKIRHTAAFDEGEEIARDVEEDVARYRGLYASGGPPNASVVAERLDWSRYSQILALYSLLENGDYSDEIYFAMEPDGFFRTFPWDMTRFYRPCHFGCERCQNLGELFFCAESVLDTFTRAPPLRALYRQHLRMVLNATARLRDLWATAAAVHDAVACVPEGLSTRPCSSSSMAGDGWYAAVPAASVLWQADQGGTIDTAGFLQANLGHLHGRARKLRQELARTARPERQTPLDTVGSDASRREASLAESGELFTLIVWHGALGLAAEIWSRLDFLNVEAYGFMHWRGPAVDSLLRFYGRSTEEMEEKVARCGDGPFLVIVATDPDPLWCVKSGSRAKPVISLIFA